MAYNDCNSAEFNSLVSIVRPVERYGTSTFYRSGLIKSTSDNFINSHATVKIISDKFSNVSLKQDNILFDNEYISYLNKIEKEHILHDSEYPLHQVKEKFSKIYSDLIEFEFNKMSVELTYDNSLIFSLNKDTNKYILQYFLDFDPNEDDDIEVIFSNQSNEENVFIEAKYASMVNIISEELYQLTY